MSRYADRVRELDARCEEEGAAAYNAGKHRQTCPYSAARRSSTHWHWGYTCAEQAYEKDTVDAESLDAEALAALIHYPECWDTACYDTLQSALWYLLSQQEYPSCLAEEPKT